VVQLRSIAEYRSVLYQWMCTSVDNESDQDVCYCILLNY